MPPSVGPAGVEQTQSLILQSKYSIRLPDLGTGAEEAEIQTLRREGYADEALPTVIDWS